ncbi:MAG: hypothetical protein SPF69_05495 [Candidatus Ornithospirochaeta sp.]|nr:hypothetical protein [Sphaerochaetaceae bacterium]MDY5523528.1 hypothetical protein [Candidatus Ornithospirochaeta sp.]
METPGSPFLFPFTLTIVLIRKKDSWNAFALPNQLLDETEVFFNFLFLWRDGLYESAGGIRGGT